MRVVTFKVDEFLLEELDRAAKSLGITRSEVIREALINYLRLSRKKAIDIKKVMLT